VTRCKIGILTLTLLVAPSATLLAASSAEAAPAQTQLRLERAATTLQSLKDQLQTARVALHTALASGDATQVSAQRAIIRHVKPQIRRLASRVHRLRFVITHPMAQGPHGSWMPVLRAAAKRYHLSAQALHRMMLLESGGRVRAVGGGGAFLGLFQYSPGTWNAKWNPFRRFSIFRGGAQIWATAHAINHGWGPSMWPNTYPMAFAR
jgi:soluble lytic murein transglycosylase-like protein